ncbi:HID1 domain containing [Willisornis vidua]|uniref:HID1 domain containing n=1 Tax=Willisornis vidua TaxID=1566151 RepID=A0ABQ9DSW2_9PASS|nr:HID1 domain containing [Willisornis vidua]
MGSADSKLNFRKAVIQLTTKTQPVEATDDAFWDQFWADTATSVQDVFALVPAAEIRAVREESPSNLATLCYKAVEKLVQGAESGCHTEKERQIVLNCCRLLTRILPYIFEDPDWRGFFWSTVPGAGRGGGDEDDENARPLAESLLLAVTDLLFCPDFTVQSHRRSTVDTAEDIHSIDSCEYIWEAGVGFAHSPQPNYIHDLNRTELLKLLLTCFSEAMYLPPSSDSSNTNPWKFLFFVLKSSDVLDILVPILYFLNDARADQSRVGLMHIGVFILLLLSGERNFGVRLNKPYSVRVPMDIPVFTGTHADLLIIVFHKIITSGHQRLQPLFDCLLTIVVNVSPYLKSLSMVAANKLLHLLEAFSTTWFLFSAVQNHHLVFFLLEVFNNIIQYQFDGNSNLVYAVIRKRNVFHQLANLPTDSQSIQKGLQRKKKSPEPISRTNSQDGVSMEGSRPAAPAEPGTLKTSLVATPGIDKLTEKSQVSEDGTMRSLEPEASQLSPEGNPPAALSDGEPWSGEASHSRRDRRRLSSASSSGQWTPTPDWVMSWKSKLPLQTIMRLLQVLVPQVEKICIDKGLTDESEILKFLQHGTLVGLLPVPHPILIRKYQANSGTAMWFRTYMWGVIYLRNVDPPIWYDTDVKLFEIQRV